MPSIWMTLTPMLDSFVHACNKTRLQFEGPLASLVQPERRALVAELGFGVLREFVNLGRIYRYTDHAVSPETVDDVSRRMSVLTKTPPDVFAEVHPAEHFEALILGRRLVEYFSPMISEKAIVIDALLPGCGIVAAAEVDVLVGETLMEVKAVDRSYERQDFRQLLTYAALCYAARSYRLDRIGVINPRLGTLAVFDLEDVCVQTSGLSSPDLLDSLIRVFEDVGRSN